MGRRRRYDDMTFDQCIQYGLQDVKRHEDRHRKRRLTILAVTIAVLVILILLAIGIGSMYRREAGQAADDLTATAECVEAYDDLSDRYEELSDLHATARDTFMTLDDTYDLDALNDVYDLDPPDLPDIDCSTNPDTATNGIDDANSQMDEYETTLEDALTPLDEKE